MAATTAMLLAFGSVGCVRPAVHGLPDTTALRAALPVMIRSGTFEWTVTRLTSVSYDGHVCFEVHARNLTTGATVPIQLRNSPCPYFYLSRSKRPTITPAEIGTLNIDGNPVYLLYTNPRQSTLKPVGRINLTQHGMFVALEATLDGTPIGVRAGPYTCSLDPRLGFDTGCG